MLKLSVVNFYIYKKTKTVLYFALEEFEFMLSAWVEVFSVIFLDAVATTDVSTGSNKDVKLVKTWTVNFA